MNHSYCAQKLVFASTVSWIVCSAQATYAKDMSANYRWTNLCILALFLVVNDSTSQITHQRNFERKSKCPIANAKLHQKKLSSKAECAVVCTDDMSCKIFNFDTTTKSCYIGDACSALTKWADGNCESFQSTELLSATVKTGIQNSLFEQLQMKMFYKFKSSGLMNEVNATQFCLSASNVTVDSNGAHFRGNKGSYLSTETPGIEQFLDNGNVFSFYVQVRHRLNTYYSTRYHSFEVCTSPGLYGNTFAQLSTGVYSSVGWTKGGLDKVFSSSQNFLIPNGQTVLLSVGYAYNRTATQHFYSSLKSTLLAAIPEPYHSYPWPTSASFFQCLRLGYDSSDDRCLNGTMYCYGMSTKILGFDDYKLLDAYCNA